MKRKLLRLTLGIVGVAGIYWVTSNQSMADEIEEYHNQCIVEMNCHTDTQCYNGDIDCGKLAHDLYYGRISKKEAEARKLDIRRYLDE